MITKFKSGDLVRCINLDYCALCAVMEDPHAFPVIGRVYRVLRVQEVWNGVLLLFLEGPSSLRRGGWTADQFELVKIQTEDDLDTGFHPSKTFGRTFKKGFDPSPGAVNEVAFRIGDRVIWAHSKCRGTIVALDYDIACVRKDQGGHNTLHIRHLSHA